MGIISQGEKMLDFKQNMATNLLSFKNQVISKLYKMAIAVGFF